MALADTARLIATLDLKGNFDARIRASEKALGSFDTKLDKTEGRAYRAGQQIGTGIKRGAAIAAGGLAFLAANVIKGLDSLTELESITTQTNAVLKSTKGVAGETADSIRGLAEKYEGLNATIDDKVIQSGENVLLTFTAIRKDAFEPAIAAALDMSTALGTDLQGSVIQIGKALQDPIKGITALRRVGVNFSADQIKVIKQLVKTGDVLGAQKVILKELNTEFGGSFLAGGNTTAGKVAKFKDSIEDLQKALATALLPTIGKVADGLSKFLADPKVVKGVSDLGQSIAGLFSDANLKAGGDFLKGAFETAKSAAPIVAASAKATFGFVQAAVGLFKQLPAPLQGLLVGGFAVNKLTGGLVTNIAGGIIDVVGKNFLQRGGTPANPLFVADVTGGLGGAAGAAGGAAGVLSKVTTLATKVFVVGLAAEAASMLSQPVVDLGKNVHDSIFGPNGDPFSDFGKAWTDWRKNADWPFGQKNAPEWAGGKPSQPASDAPNTVVAGGFDSRIVDRRFDTKGKDDRVNLNALAKGTAAFMADLRHYVKRAESDLERAKPKNAKSDIRQITDFLVKAQHGSVGETSKALNALKTALRNTHDPKLAAALRTAIHTVGNKLDYRKEIRTQIARADRILHSNESNGDKIRRLQAIAKEVGSKDHNAQLAIQKKIDAAKRAQVEAQHAATQAIKDKDLSVAVTVPVTNSVSVSSRDVVRSSTTLSRYYNVPS